MVKSWLAYQAGVLGFHSRVTQILADDLASFRSFPFIRSSRHHADDRLFVGLESVWDPVNLWVPSGLPCSWAAAPASLSSLARPVPPAWMTAATTEWLFSSPDFH